MSVSIFPSDYAKAEKIIIAGTQSAIDQVAHAIAAERERCATIAERIHDVLGDGHEIARVIRANP